MIFKRGPPPPLDDNFVFPLDEDNRRFTTFSYKRYHTNGECLLRTWLVFSISKNKVFCFYCKLFASSKIKLASDGYNDWRYIGRTLKDHETSNTHLNSYKTYIELVTRLNTNKTIDDTNKKIMESEQEYWTNVLQRII